MDETLILNLIGTFAFGLTGGILAVRKKMDLFGILVLSVATGLGGGIMRDIILGHVPPTTLVDWRYLAAAGLAGLLVFFDFSPNRQMEPFRHRVRCCRPSNLHRHGHHHSPRSSAQLGPSRVAGNAHRYWRWRAKGRTSCGRAYGAEERSIR